MNNLKRMAVALLVLIAVLILIFTDYGKQGKVYDCSIAEFHPDIPQKVKEECRKLKYEMDFYNRRNVT